MVETCGYNLDLTRANLDALANEGSYWEELFQRMGINDYEKLANNFIHFLKLGTIATDDLKIFKRIFSKSNLNRTIKRFKTNRIIENFGGIEAVIILLINEEYRQEVIRITSPLVGFGRR